jgi:hypothetical protein
MSGPAKSARKPKSESSTSRDERKPKLTDAERHKRFVAMAHEVEASNDPKDFDRAFKKVVPGKRGEPQKAAR